MSVACTLQYPIGLGLRKEASFNRVKGLRLHKRADAMTQPMNRSFLDKLPSNFASVQAAAPQAAPQEAQSYGLSNRLSDIWDFIKHGMRMLWYRKGMKAGTLTPEQWKAVQESAASLGNNRTFKDAYKLWYGKDRGEQEFHRISGLQGVTNNMPHLYKLRDMFQGGTTIKSILDAKKYWKDNKLNRDSLQSTLDYGKKYGYVSDDDYSKYSDNLGKLNAIM